MPIERVGVAVVDNHIFVIASGWLWCGGTRQTDRQREGDGGEIWVLLYASLAPAVSDSVSTVVWILLP